MTAKAEALTNDLSARISRAQLDIDTAALRQRIAELEAEVERLRADAWAAARDVQNEWLENRAMKMMEANQ